MFVWNNAMIAYQDRAARNSQYYAVIAEKIGQTLKKTDRICDAGCGLGYLSLALSQYAGQIDAVDSSASALDILRHNIAQMDLSSILPIQSSIQALQTTPYDAMVFCYFGKIAEIAVHAKRLCRGEVYVIKGRSDRHLFSKGQTHTQRETAEDMERWLKEHRIDYEQIVLDLEFGQPLLDLEDAHRFAMLYSMTETSVFSRLEKRRISDPHRECAFYLPISKPISIFRFSSRNL